MTAFAILGGLYEVFVMPLGAVSARAIFSRMMRILLEALEHIKICMDDFLVYTDNWAGHLQMLRSLFGRLRKTRLTPKLFKSMLGFGKLAFLGYTIGHRKLYHHAEKVENASRPSTKTVEVFRGFYWVLQKIRPKFCS